MGTRIRRNFRSVETAYIGHIDASRRREFFHVKSSPGTAALTSDPKERFNVSFVRTEVPLETNKGLLRKDMGTRPSA